MNHYLFETVKEKSTNNVGIVISVDETLGLAVDFPEGVKWLKENEIEVIEE
jgi:chemotaxis signal transduction protein